MTNTTPSDWSPSDQYLGRLQLAKQLRVEARDMERPAKQPAKNRVHCRGEKLSRPIYWQGKQWAVTGYGLEARDGTYAIAKHRLWEEDGRYGWVRHMAGKTWVDLSDFAEALRVARQRCGAPVPSFCLA